MKPTPRPRKMTKVPNLPALDSRQLQDDEHHEQDEGPTP